MTINGKRFPSEGRAPSLESLARDRLAMALNDRNFDLAINMVKQMRPHVGCFKLGLSLLLENGLPWVVDSIQKELGNSGCQLIVDLGGLNSSPQQVSAAVQRAAQLGVQMVLINAGGGADVLAAAVHNRGNSQIVALTVPSRLSDEHCRDIYHYRTRRAQVRHLAHLARDSGCQGLLCAAADFSKSSLHCGDMKLVVDGIRLSGESFPNNGIGLLTPREAVLQGADLLVLDCLEGATHPQTLGRNILFEVRDTLQA